MILFDMWDRRLINEYYKNTYLFRRKPPQVRQFEMYQLKKELQKDFNKCTKWFRDLTNIFF